MSKLLRYLFTGLFGMFCLAYPIAVIGVAFDVHPPFSLAWAGSALLFLEGTLLIIAAMLMYGWLRGLCAGLIVITFSYLVEAAGVGTGLPFGAYRYTTMLFPKVLGGVPMAVMFAWVLIVFGVYGWIRSEKRRIGIRGALSGAILATLLDLEIEPVAAHLQHYWEWLAPGRFNYYGVPLANFAAWFMVAFVLLLLIDMVLLTHGPVLRRGGSGEEWREDPWVALGGGHPTDPLVTRTQFGYEGRPKGPLSTTTPPPPLRFTARLLFGASLFMFGLVDITHGYYGAAALGLLAGLILCVLAALPHRALLAVAPTDRVQ